jgi:ribonuclease G
MKQIVVQMDNGHPKAALLEQGRLVEFWIEHPVEPVYAGNIYKGKVVNVLPGMQAAFLDIGLRRNAFLYIDDLLPAHQDKQPSVKPSIADLLKEGDERVVQVKKEPVGNKGARVTTHITLPGRWVVLMPEADYCAVSKKINGEGERSRLKLLAESLRRGEDGLIVRTVAEGAGQEELAADVDEQYRKWTAIGELRTSRPAPALLYRDLDLMKRLVRDRMTGEIAELVFDDRGLMTEARDWLRISAPELASRVRLYEGRKHVFDAYGVDAQLESAFQRRISLPCGGYLVVDRTEALTVIDVNTGRHIGEESLEQTVYKTNAEAAEEIARLIRLRDWGGIIIVDFIDMETDEHRRQITALLEQHMKNDRNQAMVVGWTKLGLLEITRRKVRPSLDTHYFQVCPSCAGSGLVTSKEHPSFGFRRGTSGK